MDGSNPGRKLRVLCLHGFRTSGSILQQQCAKLGSPILDLLDMTFLDGPRPCGGPSTVEGYYPPPYYEWYLPNKSYTELVGLEDCLAFLYNYIDQQGPFDGFLGFSQGACLCAALVAMQQKGLALTHHPPIKFVVIMAGGMFEDAELKNYTYPTMITCPSVHITGANDDRNQRNEDLAKIFKKPIVIRHQGKHTVPRLGTESSFPVCCPLQSLTQGCLGETMELVCCCKEALRTAVYVGVGLERKIPISSEISFLKSWAIARINVVSKQYFLSLNKFLAP